MPAPPTHAHAEAGTRHERTQKHLHSLILGNTAPTGYHLCWDIAGQDKFTGNYVKSVNCVRLREGAGHTLFNNGERTYAAPRISNTFQVGIE